MTFSEFGRRVTENASNGTDHGAAAPMFVMGGNMKAGLLGQYPSLTALNAGDLAYNVDFRSVYATAVRQVSRARLIARRRPPRQPMPTPSPAPTGRTTARAPISKVNPVAGAPAMTANWGVRSTCGAGGCVATASYLGGSGIVLVSNLVFDQVGGNWVAVGLGSTPCDNASDRSLGGVHPATNSRTAPLSGETTRSTTNSCSSGKRRVTFTRTGDPDVAENSRPGRLTAAGGVPGRSATRPLPRNDHLREWQFWARTRRSHCPHGVSSHRRSLHELVSRARRCHATGLRRWKVDPRGRGHRAVQSRWYGAYQTHRGIPAA